MRAALLVLVTSVVLNGCSLLDGRDGAEHPPLSDAAWLILDGNVWGAHFSDEDPPPSEQLPYKLFKLARDGPKWGPGVTVTAVLRLRGADGSYYLVRASQQYISRIS